MLVWPQIKKSHARLEAPGEDDQISESWSHV